MFGSKKKKEMRTGSLNLFESCLWWKLLWPEGWNQGKHLCQSLSVLPYQPKCSFPNFWRIRTPLPAWYQIAVPRVQALPPASFCQGWGMGMVTCSWMLPSSLRVETSPFIHTPLVVISVQSSTRILNYLISIFLSSSSVAFVEKQTPRTSYSAILRYITLEKVKKKWCLY